MQRDVLDILERVGLGAQVADVGVTWTRGRTYYREQQVLEITFPQLGDTAFPPFVNTPQSIVELLLEERVTGEPLIDLRCGHEVIGVAQDDGGVTVDHRGRHGPRHAPDRRRRAALGRARGCSACRSTGSPFRTSSSSPTSAPSWGSPSRSGGSTSTPPWNPGRQVLLHPQPGGVWRIDWQVPDDFDLAAERASGGLDKRIRAVVGDATTTSSGCPSTASTSGGCRACGSAGCCSPGTPRTSMSPFGARGLNSGIADADNAAWKIALDRAGAGGPGLLDSYDTERGAAAEENLRITGDTMRFLVPQTDAERAHRLDVLTRAVDDPEAPARRSTPASSPSPTGTSTRRSPPATAARGASRPSPASPGRRCPACCARTAGSTAACGCASSSGRGSSC